MQRPAGNSPPVFFARHPGLLERRRIMRLDKYLKVSRLIKRRTVANEACDNERVTVNGRPAKASYDVKVGGHSGDPLWPAAFED